jgi:hypothetical protein
VNHHLAKAIEIYGEELQQLLAWHLCHGIVVSGDEYLAFGFYSNIEKPEQAVKPCRSNTLFVTFSTGNMHKALKSFIDQFDYIAFQRSFKGDDRIAIYEIKKFYSKLK